MYFESDIQNDQRAFYDEILTKGIQRNEEQYKKWADYKKGHEKVAKALQTLQNSLYVNCMVPIGKGALMKGKLIHTNEVLACLGDGYFAKYSTAGASALCERRIQRADEMLQMLNRERDLFETRMMITDNLFEECAGSEIVEHWNDDQITEWKKKHREKEKEYHQKLAKVRQEERKKIETEEDLFNRLDQLEIEEELADELNRLEDEKYEFFGEELEEDEYYYESESSSENEEEDSKDEDNQVPDSDKKQPEKPIETCKIRKSVSFAELEKQDTINKEEKESIEEKKDDNKTVEESEDDIIRIEFSHSNENPVVKSDGDSIETPADIYRLFSKPKSILKRSPNDMNPEQAAPPEYSTEEEEEEEEEEEAIKPSAYETVIKDIKERNVAEIASETLIKQEESKDIRPISKFKRDRQLRQ